MRIGAAHSDDRLLEILNLLQLLDDGGQRRTFDLRIEGGEHERNRALSRETQQLIFETLQFWLTQPMKRRNQSGLVKVAHSAPHSLSKFRQATYIHRMGAIVVP